MRLPSPLRKGRGIEGEGKGIMNLTTHGFLLDTAQPSLVMKWQIHGRSPHPGPLPFRRDRKSVV